MVSIGSSFNMLNRHLNNDSEGFPRYPDPPQGVLSSGPLDMSVPAESFTPYSAAQETYPTTMTYDPSSLYAETPGYMYHGRSSPGHFTEDGEMRAASSNLSTASAPSAASSAVGSPQSNHGQLAPVPEWAPQGLHVSPGIVGHNDYYTTGTEYSTYPPGMDEFAPFDFHTAKAPGFVGELSNVSTPRLAHRRQCFSIASLDVSGGSRVQGVEQPLPLPGATVDYHHGHLSPSFPPLSASSKFNTTCGLVPFLSPSSASTASFPSPSLEPIPSHDWLRTPSTPGFSTFLHGVGGSSTPLESCYPSLIHPEINRPVSITFDGPYQSSHSNTTYPTSPALSHSASSPQPVMRNGSQSPFLHGGFQQQFSPYQTPMDSASSRRPSHPYVSPAYESTPFGSEDPKEKSRCPHPECGKSFKDLKAHMLTHQTERPEKCPIQTCDYHVKGFSRKYDRNRHTLTHYKGTMVCGFCPGSGSAAEKSFNRADVFKRHLTAVHGVEQTPPNSRKKTPTNIAGGKRLSGYPPDATGKCSTCSQTFANAQEFYEHLDDCVLRIVQQEDPAEAVNAKRLAEVEDDHNVIQTLEKNNLPLTAVDENGQEEDDEDMLNNDDYDSQDDDIKGPKGAARRKSGGGNPPNGVQKSRGMTHSRGGVALNIRRGRKNRRDYPSSWGFDKGQMTMKKRVMAVFEGPRRLAKDDMMLSTDHEVRVKLQDGQSYVTDLDVQTMKRAEGFLNATEEEKGPWVSDDPTEEEFKQMREMLPVGHVAT